MALNPVDLLDGGGNDGSDTTSGQGGKAPARLNSYVAIAIAVLATFLGICAVKNDNVVQQMQEAQTEKLDHWAWYQARNIREEVATATVAQLTVMLATLPEGSSAARVCQEQIAAYQKLAAGQNAKKAKLRKIAEGHARTYKELGYRDDQFDLADALLAISIAMLALTALTQRRWLFGLAMVPTVLGLIMGLAGLFGWRFHPDILIKLVT